MILALKLLLTPLLITAATLTGRRWGPAVSGWLIGLPLTSGPVSIILALQHGPDFASRAAIGTLGGQLSVLVFCLTYSYASHKMNWFFSALTAVLAFWVSTLIENRFSLLLLPMFALLILVTCLLIGLISAGPTPTAANPSAPKWDIPVRILIATTFVLSLTTFSDALGPQLSGLISPFPIYGIVLAAFAHYQQGAVAARQLLRGIALGSFAFSSFFLIIGGLLPGLGIVWTYLLATLTAVLINGLSLHLSRRFPLSMSLPAV